MLENGYIRLYRSMLKWEWYKDSNTMRVFLHLLLTANYEDKKWRGIVIKCGQRKTSYPELASELKLSERNVRTAINHLELTGEVTHEKTLGSGLFTVVNYKRFQSVTDDAPHRCQTGDRQAADDCQTGDSNERKLNKANKANKEKEIAPIIPQDKTSGIFEEYASGDEELLSALDSYEQMRNFIKSPMTDRAKSLLVGKLDRLTESVVDKCGYKIACLDEAVTSNWKSVYALKEFVDMPKQYEEAPPPAWLGKENPTIEEVLGVCFE